MIPANFEDGRAPSRFWRRVIPCPMSGCWLWIGAVNHRGYGTISIRRTANGAHRYAYERLVGEIPAGFHLDHRCRVRCCVNPAHLEPVTPRENLMRGDTFAARNASAKSCLRGHQFSPENTRVRRGRRECLTCVSAATQAQTERRRRQRTDDNNEQES